MLDFDVSSPPASPLLSQAEQYARHLDPCGHLSRPAVKCDKATGRLMRQQDEMSISDVCAAVRKARDLFMMACQAYRAASLVECLAHEFRRHRRNLTRYGKCRKPALHNPRFKAAPRQLRDGCTE